MTKGDIVLIPFPFTKLTGNKLRPAIVLITAELDITVSFITTQLNWQEPTDVELSPTIENGIKRKSLIRLSKIATIDKKLALGKIGRISEVQIFELNVKLKYILQLD
jgi:mRNA interferase MazF